MHSAMFISSGGNRLNPPISDPTFPLGYYISEEQYVLISITDITADWLIFFHSSIDDTSRIGDSLILVTESLGMNLSAIAYPGYHNFDAPVSISGVDQA